MNMGESSFDFERMREMSMRKVGKDRKLEWLSVSGLVEMPMRRSRTSRLLILNCLDRLETVQRASGYANIAGKSYSSPQISSFARPVDAVSSLDR